MATHNGEYEVILGNDVDSNRPRTGNYKIIKYIGCGTFGKALKCWDRNNKKYVLIKVINKNYSRAAQDEIKYMKLISELDKDDTYYFGRYVDSFVNYLGHYCIITDIYGMDFFKIIVNIGYKFNTYQLARIAKQLSQSIGFMHTNGLIHTDLKPENILIDDIDGISDTLQIRVIDFGGTYEYKRNLTYLIQTSGYRAPEVIMKEKWDFSVDVWSIGCILYEIVTGDVLFDVHKKNDEYYLNLIQSVLYPYYGPIPKYLHPNTWFTCKYNLDPISTKIKDSDLASLILMCLNYEPSMRIRAIDIQNHPFVTKNT